MGVNEVLSECCRSDSTFCREGTFLLGVDRVKTIQFLPRRSKTRHVRMIPQSGTAVVSAALRGEGLFGFFRAAAERVTSE